MSDLPRLLRAKDVAEALAVSRAAIFAMASRGQIPGALKVGRRLRFDPESLLSWLAELRAEARPPVLGPRALAVLPSRLAKRDAIAEGGKR